MLTTKNYTGNGVNYCIFCCKPTKLGTDSETKNIEIGLETEPCGTRQSEQDKSRQSWETNRDLVTRFFNLVQRFGKFDLCGNLKLNVESVQTSDFQFCEDCSKIVSSFCVVYHEMKVLEMKLHWKLGILKELVTGADKVPSRMYFFKQSWNDEEYKVVRRFRRNIVKKFSGMLKKTTPRLTLNKETNPPKIPVHPEDDLMRIPDHCNESVASAEDVAQNYNDDDDFSDFPEPSTETFVELPTQEILSASMENATNELVNDNPTTTTGVKVKWESGVTKEIPETHIPTSPISPICSKTVKNKRSRKQSKLAPDIEETKAPSSEDDLNETISSLDLDSSDNEISPPKKKRLAKKIRKYTCPEDGCDRGFNSEQNLANHQSLHGNFSCAFCETVENFTVNLALHEHNLHSSNDDDIESNSAVNYKCPRCQKQFPSKPGYIVHHRMVHLNITSFPVSNMGTCSICQIKVHQAHQDKHFQSHHNREGVNPEDIYKCGKEQCQAYFLTEKQLAYHVKRSHVDNPNEDDDDDPLSESEYLEGKESKGRRGKYRCNVCGSILKTAGGLQVHKRTHSGKSRGNKFKCNLPNCISKFKTAEELEHHQNVLHGSFPCNFCEVVKEYAPELALHEASQHSKGSTRKLYNCARCFRKFGNEAGYISHHLKYHLNVQSPSKVKARKTCEICKVDLYDKKGVREHRKSHHSIEGMEPDMIQRCDQCTAYFVKAEQLKIHKGRFHGNGNRKKKRGLRKQHICSECDVVFTSFRTLWEHKEQVHGSSSLSTNEQVGKIEPELVNEAINIFKCPICQRECKSQGGLDKHMFGKHANSESKKKYVCDMCGKTCKDNDELRKHCLSHTGPDSWQFQCSVCGRKCLSKCKLDDHLRTHTKEKPFICHICGGRYAHRHNWRYHMKKKHDHVV